MVQAQENQFGVSFPDIARAIGAQERIYLHDLRPEVPELARDPLLATKQCFPVGLVRIGELQPEPAPRAREHA